MATKERSKAEWVSNLACRCFEMLRARIESLRDELVMVLTPLILVMVQHTNEEMDFISCSDFKLFWSAFL